MTTRIHVYLDESPSLVHSEKFFMIGLFLAENEIRAFERIPKKIRQARRGKLKQNEFKFHTATDSERTRLLSQVAKKGGKVVIFGVDTGKEPIDDTPEHNGIVVGAALSSYWNKYVQLYDEDLELIVTVDKKFTSPRDRKIFDHQIKQRTNLNIKNDIEHADSCTHNLIQIADFVAGAANRKYNQGNGYYLEILKERGSIVLEETITWGKLL